MRPALLLPGDGRTSPLPRLVGRMCFPATAVGPATLDQGNPITLGLADQGPVELRKGAMTEGIRFAQRRALNSLEFAQPSLATNGHPTRVRSPMLFLWHKE